MHKRLLQFLFHAGHHADDNMALRRWFLFFVIFLAALALTATQSLHNYDTHPSGLSWRIWLSALYLFYMALCCTFFPAPTAWLVMLLASPAIQFIPPDALARLIPAAATHADTLAAVATVVLVATLGALGTAIANLNEYYLITFLLRFGRTASYTTNRFYRAALRWFQVSPFGLMLVFNILPIPIDLVRWLAISRRYSRPRYFLATFVGRALRYGALAAAATCLAISIRDILIIQSAIILLVIGRYAAKICFQRNQNKEILANLNPDQGVSNLEGTTP